MCVNILFCFLLVTSCWTSEEEETEEDVSDLCDSAVQAVFATVDTEIPSDLFIQLQDRRIFVLLWIHGQIDDATYLYYLFMVSDVYFTALIARDFEFDTTLQIMYSTIPNPIIVNLSLLDVYIDYDTFETIESFIDDWPPPNGYRAPSIASIHNDITSVFFQNRVIVVGSLNFQDQLLSAPNQFDTISIQTNISVWLDSTVSYSPFWVMRYTTIPGLFNRLTNSTGRPNNQLYGLVRYYVDLMVHDLHWQSYDYVNSYIPQLIIAQLIDKGIIQKKSGLFHDSKYNYFL